MIWLRHQPSTIIGLSHFLYWNVCNFHTSLCVVVACKLLNSLLKWVLVCKSILFYSQREWKTSWHFYRFINFNAYTLRWFDAFNAFNVQQWQRNEIQLMNALSNLMWPFAYAIKLLWCSDFYAMPTNLNFPILIGDTHTDAIWIWAMTINFRMVSTPSKLLLIKYCCFIVTRNIRTMESHCGSNKSCNACDRPHAINLSNRDNSDMRAMQTAPGKK